MFAFWFQNLNFELRVTKKKKKDHKQVAARNLIPDYKGKCYDTTILMISSWVILSKNWE